MIDGIYVRIGLVALLLGVGAFGGCRLQESIDAPVIAKKDAALRDASEALRDAAAAHRGWAVRFQMIDATAAENVGKAKAEKVRAEQAARSAVMDREAAQARVDTLEQQLAAERDGCVDGRRPICGIPLR